MQNKLVSFQLQHQLIPKITLLFNQITGYTNVERQKLIVQEKDAQLSNVKVQLKEAKDYYQSVIDERQKTQREIHSLLQRQPSWLDMDVLRFTELYRKDVNLVSEECQAKTKFSNASDTFDRAHSDYLNSIRERYMEEQLYSDKIRRASTYWTLGLITSHLLVFVLYQVIVEPRKQSALKKDISLMFQEALETVPFTESPDNTLSISSIGTPAYVLTESTQTDQVLFHEIPYWLMEPKFIQGFLAGASVVTFILSFFK